MKVTILGANSLLGQHLIKYIQENTKAHTEVTTWCYQSKLANKIDIDTNLTHYIGTHSLHSAIKNSDIIVNLHEFQDLCLLPDVNALNLHNVEFVRSLVFLMNSGSKRNQGLIHNSSCFVQCSTFLPNVYEAEMNLEKYYKSRPFEEYCKSKASSEEIVKQSGIPNFVVRSLPLYGPGDESSIITDMIASTSLVDCVPNIGDRDGVAQMAFAGNVAVGMWLAIQKLHTLLPTPQLFRRDSFESSDALDSVMDEENDDSASDMSSNLNNSNDNLSLLHQSDCVHEVLLLADDIRSRNIYESHSELICSSKRPLSLTYLPFLPLYYLYLFLTTLILLLSKIMSLPQYLEQLPDPYFFYHYFHHWTFFNTFKASSYLNYEDKYSHEEVLTICRPYYQRLSGESVNNFSWKPNLL